MGKNDKPTKVVPVVLTCKIEVCRSCHGTGWGEEDGIPTDVCPICNGTGLVKKVREIKTTIYPHNPMKV